MAEKSLVNATLIFLITFHFGFAIKGKTANISPGLSVFGTVFGLFTFGLDIFDNNKADEKFDQIINKLNSVETKLKKLSLTVQYNKPEQNILIAFDILQKLLKETDNTTALKYLDEFNNYMKNHYAEAGTKIYDGVFQSDRLFGSSMFEEPPENLTECYKFHAAIMLLLSKAATVELAYDVRNELSGKTLEQNMETWENRIMKLQDSKEILCDTFNMCKMASKSTEKWKIYFVATIALSSVLGIVALFVLPIVVYCACKRRRNRRKHY